MSYVMFCFVSLLSSVCLYMVCYGSHVNLINVCQNSHFFQDRDIYGFWSIPYAESTGGENRFQPPKPRAPLNDGRVRKI